VETDGFVACYAGLVLLLLDELWLVSASCDLPGTVLVGVHLATHHESFWSAAILIVAHLGIVQDKRCESHNGPSNCRDDNAKNPEAAFALQHVRCESNM
jgi:hypothetical protein